MSLPLLKSSSSLNVNRSVLSSLSMTLYSMNTYFTLGCNNRFSLKVSELSYVCLLMLLRLLLSVLKISLVISMFYTEPLHVYLTVDKGSLVWNLATRAIPKSCSSAQCELTLRITTSILLAFRFSNISPIFLNMIERIETLFSLAL